MTGPANASAAPAASTTVWLCLPGHKPDPCAPSLTTTRESSTNIALGVEHIRPAKDPKIDCFYVYPTVSDQKTAQANLDIDPEERSIALYQAAYYSRYCRVFAPMYRQATLVGIGAVTAPSGTTTSGPPPAPADGALAYADVLGAWRTYLKKYNHGRGVVFIGHSQGSFELEALLSRQVDDQPSVRKLLVSAIILGGNVTVKKGSDVGGTFRHIPACRSTTQLGCVVAFSTFDAPVPADSLFGRTSRSGLQVLCTDPAALAGGSAPLDAVLPTAPFAPGTIIGQATALLGVNPARVPTPWVEYPDSYRGGCSSAGGAGVLQIEARNGAPTIHAVPTPGWGLHLVDAQIALGNLVKMVGVQAAGYFRKTGR
ncbi:MAG TPA: DUF3089 domain-containing protein [Acidimicrobiales bacterium]